MHDIISVENLTKRYGQNVVFNNLSFSLPHNRVIGLLGENGIGKTTLLRLMAGVIKPDSGKVYIDDQVVSQKTKSQVSFLLAPSNLYVFMRVKDAVQYYKDFHPDFDFDTAIRLCQEFALDLSCKVQNLSKGNQERLCLLLTLSRNVPLYLFDEPIAGFDPKFKQELLKTILENISKNATVIISSHLLRDLQSIFDEILILKKGEIILTSTSNIHAKGKTLEDFYMEIAEK